MRNDAYESSKIYKDKTNKRNENQLRRKEFQVGDRILLFNARLKIFLGKLALRWTGPYAIIKVTLYGVIRLRSSMGIKFPNEWTMLEEYQDDPKITKVN